MLRYAMGQQVISSMHRELRLQLQDWSVLELPCGRMASFYFHLGRIFVTDAQDCVFAGDLDLGGAGAKKDRVVWREAGFTADRVRASSCGRIFWRGRRGAAFALKNFNGNDSWFEIAPEGVKEFEVNDCSALILKEVKK